MKFRFESALVSAALCGAVAAILASCSSDDRTLARVDGADANLARAATYSGACSRWTRIIDSQKGYSRCCSPISTNVARRWPCSLEAPHRIRWGLQRTPPRSWLKRGVRSPAKRTRGSQRWKRRTDKVNTSVRTSWPPSSPRAVNVKTCSDGCAKPSRTTIGRYSSCVAILRSGAIATIRSFKPWSGTQA